MPRRLSLILYGDGAHRPGRGKVRPRVVVEEQSLRAAVPAGSRFCGYDSFLAQELVLCARCIRSRRERWLTPKGQVFVAPRPDEADGHFGPDLRRFVLAQYHQRQVTVPRLLAQRHAFGLAISKR